MQYYALLLLLINFIVLIGTDNTKDRVATTLHLLLYSPLFLRALGAI